MAFLPQVFFVALLIVGVYFFSKRVAQIRRNILVGKDQDFSDNKGERIKNMLLLAFGQKKMFFLKKNFMLYFVTHLRKLKIF